MKEAGAKGKSGIVSLMLWERPNHTICFLISFHCLFWFLVWSQRLLSLIFTLAFLLSSATIWKTKIWPEISGESDLKHLKALDQLIEGVKLISLSITVSPTEDQLEREAWICVHPDILTIPEIVQLTSQVMQSLRSAVQYALRARDDRPGCFCLVATFFFSLTAFVGQIISGPLLIYTFAVVLFLTPTLLSFWNGSLRCSINLAEDDQQLLDSAGQVPKTGVFDAFLENAEVESYNLDKELGIMKSDVKREGSDRSSCGSNSSIRIVSSHFESQPNSSGQEKESSDEGSSSVLDEDEPFEMISAEEDLTRD